MPPATTIGGASPGLGIATGKADASDSDPTAVNPGGVPIFKNGQVVGGIGITGVSLDIAEYVAFTAMRVNVGRNIPRPCFTASARRSRD